MSIEVRVSTSDSPYRTCINVPLSTFYVQSVIECCFGNRVLCLLPLSLSRVHYVKLSIKPSLSLSILTRLCL